MPSEEEKIAFAQRLRIALNQLALRQLALSPSAKPIKGGADLARQFNLKHAGGAGVSPQAAHKWLKGRVIPTADKIKTLAEWLGVSEHWLHYGPPPAPSLVKEKKSLGIHAKYPPSEQTVTLAKRIEALPEHQRYLVEELVGQFYGKMPE